LRAATGEGWGSFQHLVQHATEGVYIRAGSEFDFTHCLLGAHVGHGADGHASAGEPGLLALGHLPGDAEVGDGRVTGVKQDVLRLDVTVDQSPTVRVC